MQTSSGIVDLVLADEEDVKRLLGRFAMKGDINRKEITRYFMMHSCILLIVC